MKLPDNFINKAKSLGFVDVRIAPSVVNSKFGDQLKKNVSKKYHGKMSWLAREPEKRIDANNLLENAKSVICLVHPVPIGEIKHPTRAKFARGEDYHKSLKDKLKILVNEVLKNKFTKIQTKICVDTSPIFEKAFAASCGLGWIGKHTLLIHPKYGSNIVLGEIITNVEFEFDFPIKDQCGACEKCLKACPTNALIAPYELNASKCISYLTVEHDDKVPPEYEKYIKEDSYGCDICIDACPYSKSKN